MACEWRFNLESPKIVDGGEFCFLAYLMWVDEVICVSGVSTIVSVAGYITNYSHAAPSFIPYPASAPA